MTSKTSFFKIFILSAALAASVTLAACAGTARPDTRCPTAGFMPGADTLRVFADMAAPKAAEQKVRADMVNYKYGCRPVPAKGSMEVALTLDFQAERLPPAGAMKGLTLPYFIAVLDPQEKVVERRAFTVRLKFDEAGRVVQSEDHRILVAMPAPQAAPGYKIAFGFELTPAQLAFNRNG